MERVKCIGADASDLSWLTKETFTHCNDEKCPCSRVQRLAGQVLEGDNEYDNHHFSVSVPQHFIGFLSRKHAMFAYRLGRDWAYERSQLLSKNNYSFSYLYETIFIGFLCLKGKHVIERILPQA